MKTCEELNQKYQEIKQLKQQLDLEFQKSQSERNYLGVVSKLKKEINEKVGNLEFEINPIPRPLRGNEGVRIEQLEIGGKTKKQLIQEMEDEGMKISDLAMDMLNSKDFTTSAKPEFINLIHLKVGDLGFPEGKKPTTDEIYKRIKELGLELCPPEVGPSYRLKYTDQPKNEWINIGMKQIKDRYGRPGLLRAVRGFGDGMLLGDLIIERPTDGFVPVAEFVFCLCPPSDKKATGG